MTRFSQSLRAAAPGAAALLVMLPAARAQLPTIDVGAIAKAVEMIQKAQDQIDKVEEVRAEINREVTKATRPWTQLATQAAALQASAISLPASLTAPPAIGGVLEGRVEGTATVPAGGIPNAEYVTPQADTAAQVTAAITPTVAADPLQGERAARVARERLLREPARLRIAADRLRRAGLNAADARLAGRGMNVLAAAGTAIGQNDASSAERTWSALWERNAALTQTVAVLQSQALAYDAAGHERRTLERQEALARASRERIAALQAVARSKAAHAAYMANPNRDAGDDRFEECGGRFYSGGCETVPQGF